MNKKAAFTEWTMLLATVILILSSFYFVVMFQGKTANAISIENASDFFREQKKFEIYSEDLAGLAVQQAYSEAVNSVGSKCGKSGDLIIWTAGCPDNAEIESIFIKRLNETLKSNGLDAKEIIISDKIAMTFSRSSEMKELSNIAYYRINYSYLPKVFISKPDLDLEQVYDEAYAKNVSASFENWNSAVEDTAGYYKFTLTSKKSYFYDNSFKPVVLTFSFKKTA